MLDDIRIVDGTLNFLHPVTSLLNKTDVRTLRSCINVDWSVLVCVDLVRSEHTPLIACGFWSRSGDTLLIVLSVSLPLDIALQFLDLCFCTYSFVYNDIKHLLLPTINSHLKNEKGFSNVMKSWSKGT